MRVCASVLAKTLVGHAVGHARARLPSSRNPVHRRLWIPYPRTSGDSPLRPPRHQTSRISTRPRPRGAADPTRTAYRKLDRDNPKTTHGRAGSNPLALPVLPSLPSSTTCATTTTLPRIVVTQ